MDCARSIELLSEYDAGLLGEDDRLFVTEHLSICADCDGVFQDLRLIIRAAVAARSGDDIAYPDGEVIWRLLSARRIGH